MPNRLRRIRAFARRHRRWGGRPRCRRRRRRSRFLHHRRFHYWIVGGLGRYRSRRLRHCRGDGDGFNFCPALGTKFRRLRQLKSAIRAKHHFPFCSNRAKTNQPHTHCTDIIPLPPPITSSGEGAQAPLRVFVEMGGPDKQQKRRRGAAPFGSDQLQPQRAAAALATRALKPSASAIAISESILRLTVMPALVRPSMKRE